MQSRRSDSEVGRLVGKAISAVNSRIAIVMRDLHMGGVERALLSLALALAKEEREVRLILFSDSGSLRSSVENIGVVGLGVPSSIRAHPLSFATAVRRLRNEICDWKPYAVISAKEQCNTAALAARALMAAPTPRMLITRHSPLAAASSQGESSWLTKALCRITYPHADAIVCVSKGLAAEVTALLPDRNTGRVHQIDNPVIDGNFFSRAKDPVAYWPPSDGNTIVAVGRLSYEKGFDLLVDGFARTKSRTSSLVLVGDGPERTELEARAASFGISSRVHFIGEVANPLPYIQRADCVVVPSRYEGFGMVLVEALALNRRTIAFDYSYGAAQITANGRFARLLTPGDVPGLTSSLDSIDELVYPLDVGFDPSVYLSSTVAQAYLDVIANTDRQLE